MKYKFNGHILSQLTIDIEIEADNEEDAIDIFDSMEPWEQLQITQELYERLEIEEEDSDVNIHNIWEI